MSTGGVCGWLLLNRARSASARSRADMPRAARSAEADVARRSATA
ncbi:hypothetical protein NKH18_38915 [Streptomyces sp. M10(2022)]